MGAAYKLDNREESNALTNGIYLHKPAKIHISVCRCFNCHMNHADLIVEKLHKELGIGRNEWISRDEMISFDSNLNSIGLCSRDVMIKVNQNYYFGMTELKVKDLIHKLKHEYGSSSIEDILKSL